jgi:uncharacterized integral membrane protein
MDKEELSLIENKINNPPNDVKIKNYSDKTVVKVYAHNPVLSLITIPIILYLVLLFLFIARNGEQIFTSELEFMYTFTPLTFGLLIILCVTILLIYWSLYYFFGYIKIVFGAENYIFKGFFAIGVKRHIDWNKIMDLFQYEHEFDSEGSTNIVPYIVIKINESKTIRYSLEHLNNNKVTFIVSLIKYLKYKEKYDSEIIFS